MTVFAKSLPLVCVRAAISWAVKARECVMVTYLTPLASRNSFSWETGTVHLRSIAPAGRADGWGSFCGHGRCHTDAPGPMIPTLGRDGNPVLGRDVRLKSVIRALAFVLFSVAQ